MAQKVNIVLQRQRGGSKLGKSMAHGERPRGWLLERLLRWQRRGVVLQSDQAGQDGRHRVDGAEHRRGAHHGVFGQSSNGGAALGKGLVENVVGIGFREVQGALRRRRG